MRMASIRLRAPILMKTRDRWLRTVLGVTDSRVAISAVLAPAAARRRTSHSRSVSGFAVMVWAVRGQLRVEHGPAGHDPAYAPREQFGRRVRAEHAVRPYGQRAAERPRVAAADEQHAGAVRQRRT
jgi:hypothetical protein